MVERWGRDSEWERDGGEIVNGREINSKGRDSRYERDK